MGRGVEGGLMMENGEGGEREGRRRDEGSMGRGVALGKEGWEKFEERERERTRRRRSHPH